MNNTNDIPLKQIIESALSKIGEVVDVNTVIGEPIILGEVTLIPFSKVAVGFASGGTEFGGKNPRADGKAYFAGGNGAGVTMTPLGFIAVEKGVARVIELGNPATYQAPQDPVNRVLDGINGVIEKVPDIVDKIMNLINSYSANTESEAEAVEEILTENE
ncbi:MAG: sporulation protein YtfJ [Clostridia bacterium]|nr:sporulation protein YtfJ [Clostridia bacterium]MBR6783337.1 sporulation protein YtfJ [Clostridia bacterium]